MSYKSDENTSPKVRSILPFEALLEPGVTECYAEALVPFRIQRIVVQSIDCRAFLIHVNGLTKNGEFLPLQLLEDYLGFYLQWETEKIEFQVENMMWFPCVCRLAFIGERLD